MSQNAVSSVNFHPTHSCRSFSLSMFINHCESLLCKFISKAPNEPRQPTDHQRPHKICEFNSAETVGGHWARRHGALPCIVM